MGSRVYSEWETFIDPVTGQTSERRSWTDGTHAGIEIKMDVFFMPHIPDPNEARVLEYKCATAPNKEK